MKIHKRGISSPERVLRRERELDNRLCISLSLDLLPDYSGYRKGRKPIVLQYSERSKEA